MHIPNGKGDENMPYAPSEENVINGHGKEGFIKAGVKHMDTEDIRYILDNLKTN